VSKELNKFYGLAAQVSQKVETAAVIQIRGRGTRPTTVTTPVSRKIDALKTSKTLDSLAKFRDQKQALEGMAQQLAQHFVGDKTGARLLKEIKALSVEIDSKLEGAKQMAGRSAERTVDPEFKAQVSKIYRALTKRFEGLYKATDLSYLHLPDSNASFAYLHWKDLEDDSKFVHPDYYVLVGERNKDWLAAIANEHILPNEINWSVKTNKAEQLLPLINHELAADKFVSVVAPRSAPITQEQLNFRDPRVAKAEIKDNHIIVKLQKVTDKTKDKAAADILAELRAIVFAANPSAASRRQLEQQKEDKGLTDVHMVLPTTRSKDLIKYRVFKRGTIWYIDFVFILPVGYKGQLLSDNMITHLKTTFGLNDQQVHKLQQTLDNI
jgi:hypothetical protein